MSDHLDPQDSAGIVMLASGDPERVAAEAHARACPPCAEELDRARRTLEALGALDRGLEASPERLAEIRASIPALGPRGNAGDRRAAWAAVLAAVATAGAALAIFRGISDGALAWLTAGAALVVGIGAIATVRDQASGRTATIVATAGALALAMVSIEPGGSVEWRHAALCAGTQMVGALGPVLVAVAFPSEVPPSGWMLTGRGAGGALVALGALCLVCPAHSASHVIVFHVLTIGAAAMVATIVGGAAVDRQTQVRRSAR